MGTVENLTSTINAFAKLNLCLNVTGRRGDGYHLLSMLNVRIDLCDTLTITPQAGSRINCTVSGLRSGVHGEDLAGSPDNSIVKAVRQYQEAFGIEEGFEIHLDKRIPVGAGLGGGSSDAAATLQYLVTRYGSSNEDAAKIKKIAEKIGADVPYLMQRRPAVVDGIGEGVHPFDMDYAIDAPVLVLSPPVALSTKEVFAAYAAAPFEGKVPKLIQGFQIDSWDALLRCIENDLQSTAVRLAPKIGGVLGALRGISGITASMTGSGSAVFCLSRGRDFTEEDLRAVSKASKVHNCTLYECRIIS